MEDVSATGYSGPYIQDQHAIEQAKERRIPSGKVCDGGIVDGPFPHVRDLFGEGEKVVICENGEHG